jgi:predicted phage replisome organizer
MAEYDKTKLFWLQLKEDFFDEDALTWIEEQPNGEKYSLFYLKLCLKSLKTSGLLIRKVGEMLMPYDEVALAKLTNTKDVDTVKVAMNLFVKIGLVRMLENGTIYITQLENMVGAKTIGSLKKQQQRIIGGQKVDNCPPEIEINREIEIEIEKDIDKPRTQKHKYGTYKNILLTDDEHSKLIAEENGQDAIEFLSEAKEMKGYKYKSDYLAIKKWVFDALKEKKVKEPKQEQKGKYAGMSFSTK